MSENGMATTGLESGYRLSAERIVYDRLPPCSVASWLAVLHLNCVLLVVTLTIRLFRRFS